jgi:sterol 3beta-glucosyltransferase
MDEKDEKHRAFNLYTPNRVYHLRADSDASARQWVKQLQKVIFKSRNQGNNVKVHPFKNSTDSRFPFQ